MKKNNLKRFLASLLAVLMLASVTGVSPAVFADFGESSRSGIATQAAKSGEKISLKGDNFSIRIPYNDDGSINFDALYQKLFDECVDVSNSTPQQRSEVTIERYGSPLVYVKLEGENIYSAIEEDKTYEIKFTYHFGWKNLNFKDATCNVTFLGRQAVPEIANKDITVDASFNEDLSIDYGALREAIWEQVSVDLPTNVKFDKVSFEYKYNDTLNIWEAFEGKNIVGDKGIPALDLGANQVKLTWGGDKEYKSWEQEITVNVVDGRTDTSITFVDEPTVKIPYNEDISVDMSALTENIWAIVNDITPDDISKDKITVLFDGKTLDKASISEGSHTLTFKYAGTQTYKNFSTDVTVYFVGREAAFELIPDVTKVDMKFASATSYDYKATAKAIREAVVKKLAADESINLSDVTVEYNAAYVGTNFKPLDNKDIATKKLTADEEFTFRLSWGGSNGNGTALYKPFSAEVKLTLVDNRLASEIKVVADPSITYNKDGSAEKAAIIASVIDYTNSTLPAGAEFTVEVPTIVDTSIGTIWKDITDNTMDAGENQKIRISFAGNAEYKPCEIVTFINVKKAPVSITLPIISKLYAGEEVDPETYYEVNPEDPAIDVYLFFVGVNTNKETCVNVKLTPDQEKLLKVIPSVYDKLREGMKLREFKEFIESIPNIDKIEVIKNILNILNTFDNISDNTVIAIGTPAHAGVYQAIAVSPETKNYEAGKCTGSLIILKNWKSVKLEKSDMFTGSKNGITVTNATKIANGEEGAYAVVLTQNGVILNNNAQKAVHYLFTGINHGKLYSSSKMPVEPGRYIVTATVRGGDFFAFPKTFSFTIVADSTPNT